MGIHTSPLFVLIWNMAALCYERGPERRFEATFHDGLQELLVGDLTVRVHSNRPNPEKLAQLALGGLLAFLFPQNKERVVKVLAPLKGANRRLEELALKQTFVPAYFALQGIAIQTKRSKVFTPATCAALLKKFEEYDNVGPALETLRLRVSRMQKKGP
jgi:hypothetical protein